MSLRLPAGAGASARPLVVGVGLLAARGGRPLAKSVIRGYLTAG